MAALLNILGIVLVAFGVLVVLTTAITVQRLLKMRWKTIASQPIPKADVPDATRQTLSRPAAELASLGFTYLSSGLVDKALIGEPDSVTFFDLYRHHDGHTHAMVSPAPMPDRHQPCVVQFATCLNNGDNWTTVNRFKHQSPAEAPGWRIFDDYCPTWQQALQRHLRRVSNAADPVCTDSAEVWRRLHLCYAQLVPHMVQQGMLRRAELDGQFRLEIVKAIQIAVAALWGQLRAGWAVRNLPAPSMPTTAVAGHAVAAAGPNADNSAETELAAFQAQVALRSSTPSSVKRKWLIFGITGLLFGLVGGAWLSWSFVLILLLVIAIHEGGHYLAMRLAGYRNVSVFFVPGLGGITTGTKLDAAPLQKLLVYLAGPVPGMVLAGFAFWASATSYSGSSRWLAEFAIVAATINFFNLLPIVPLDGGRVLEAMVFCRLPRLRFAFAVLCCGLLFGLGLLLNEGVLKVLAVLFALALPHQWRLMQLDQTLLRTHPAKSEADALRTIFAALQAPKFTRWSYSKRSAMASALVPELMGRRPNWCESVVGLAIYACALIVPISAAFLAVPQLGRAASVFLPSAGIAPDDVEPASEAAVPPAIDWSARLADATRLSDAERLVAYLGAAGQANDSEDTATAARHYRFAWDLAQTLPVRDQRRIEAMEGLANVTDQDSERDELLKRIVAELDQPQGDEREWVANAKEQLSYGAVNTAEQVKLLREVVALRSAAGPPHQQALLLSQLSLAKALDRLGDASSAEAELRKRIDQLTLAPKNGRSREALHLRQQTVTGQIDLVWFLMGHARSAEAQKLVEHTMNDLPEKITVSWVWPQQQTLEAALWAQLSGQQTNQLPSLWEAYEATLQGPFGMHRASLVHEADRALVAKALQNERLLAQAQKGMAAVKTQIPGASKMLCDASGPGAADLSRSQQREARRRVLAELGVCPPLPPVEKPSS